MYIKKLNRQHIVTELTNRMWYPNQWPNEIIPYEISQEFGPQSPTEPGQQYRSPNRPNPPNLPQYPKRPTVPRRPSTPQRPSRPYFHHRPYFPHRPTYFDESTENDVVNKTLDEQLSEEINKYLYKEVIKKINILINIDNSDEYEFLASVIGNDKDKVIIEQIRDDEKKHKKLLQDIYKSINGKIMENTYKQENTMYKNNNYIDCLENVLCNKQKAIESYRDILRKIPEYYKDVIFEIIFTELLHSNKLNYLYAKSSV